MSAPRPEPGARAEIDALLARMSELGASDLFLVVGAPPTVAVAKKLSPLGETPLSGEDLARLAVPFLRGREQGFAARPDLDLAHSVHGVGRFRVNVFRQRGDLGIVARRVQLAIPSVASLGLPSVLEELALELRGLFLVTGAAGTGKSTTLAAMIGHRNARLAGHIVTIEDPIEFLHPHVKSLVTQREVGIDTASFADGLRSALRQAPDVLVLGEVRDRETADAALRFAETGHLVLATLHATNATEALERLVSIFPEDAHGHVLSLLSLVLKGIVSQRLVPRSDHPGERVAAVEVLLPTQRVREAVRKGDMVGVKVALREGGGAMQCFDEALVALVKAGRLAREDAAPYADSPTDFQLRFRLEEATAPRSAGKRALRLL